ncbi:ATP-binding protein [Paenibacillus turpanensis]|uniref:ATP-binding protein n=1 Tax=Paenibacillus turpanensis TaxID=2689078 RepID=UPI001408B76C|nr:ATP-binding protein [Paenibacillus turpanensis]
MSEMLKSEQVVVLGQSQRQGELYEQAVRDLNAVISVKNKYEHILQHMDTCVFLVDQAGFVSFVNIPMAKLLKVSRALLTGCDLKTLLRHPLIPRSRRKLIYRVYIEMFQRRRTYYEFSDSDNRHYLVTVTYPDELDGDYLISVKDVTDFRRIEQSAYRNDKLAMLGKIAAAIAHEIRNPLTSVRGFIQLLQPYLAKVGKEEYGNVIVQEIDRANEIIHEFLNSSKPSAPVIVDTDVTSLLKEVILLTESSALLAGCEIRLEHADEALLRVDAKQIKQVLLNVVKNAVEAIKGSDNDGRGIVRITCHKAGSYAQISVQDNGRGMDAVTQSRLFDPFFTTKEEGTGLGLAVCYRIIKNHSGFVQVESEPGMGTTILVVLPLKPR